MIKLSNRLKLIYDMVPKCETVCDVGCDHGYLTIALLEGGKAKNAIAMDVNASPLDSAKRNVAAYGLTDRVQFRLSDGLKEFKEHEADVICICGMGGALIERILANGLDILKKAVTIILEPQSEYSSLRLFLSNNGFAFLDESLCEEQGKIYPIMKLCYNSKDRKSLSEAELKYGPIIIDKKPTFLKKQLQKDEKEYKSILKRLDNISDSSMDLSIQKRKAKLIKELELINKLRLEMEGEHG